MHILLFLPALALHTSKCTHFRGLAVGIYTTNSPEACQFVVDDCKANVVVVENQKQLDKILKVFHRGLPGKVIIISYRQRAWPGCLYQHAAMISWPSAKFQLRRLITLAKSSLLFIA